MDTYVTLTGSPNGVGALQHGLEASGDGFLDSLEHRSLLPEGSIELLGILEIARERRVHLLSKTDAQDDCVDFIVTRDAPPIQVRGTDSRPDPVDSRGLRMQHLALPQIYFDARVQQLGKVRTGRRLNQRLVGVPGEKQANVHSSSRRTLQRFEHL